MAAALKRFAGPTLPGAGPTTVLTVPPGATWTIKQIVLSNTDAANHPITVGIGGVAPNQQIVPNANVAANVVSTVNLTLPMVGGETLQVASPSGFIAVTVTGIEQ